MEAYSTSDNSRKLFQLIRAASDTIRETDWMPVLNLWRKLDR